MEVRVERMMFWRERERESKDLNGGPPCGQVRVLVVGDSGMAIPSLFFFSIFVGCINVIVGGIVGFFDDLCCGECLIVDGLAPVDCHRRFI